MTVYADTSVLVSLYVEDRHSAAADRMLRAVASLQATPLHIAEWNHAIAQQVFRGQMSNEEAGRIHHEFENDRAAGLWSHVEMPEKALDLCAELARRYGPKFGVRTLDSLHVACALEFKAQRFWTFDDRQRKLARALGLSTV